jgi:hypothetical protein
MVFNFWSDVMNQYLTVSYELNEGGVALFLSGDTEDEVFNELVDAVYNYTATEDIDAVFTEYEFI